MQRWLQQSRRDLCDGHTYTNRGSLRTAGFFRVSFIFASFPPRPPLPLAGPGWIPGLTIPFFLLLFYFSWFPFDAIFMKSAVELDSNTLYFNVSTICPLIYMSILKQAFTCEVTRINHACFTCKQWGWRWYKEIRKILQIHAVTWVLFLSS